MGKGQPLQQMMLGKLLIHAKDKVTCYLTSVTNELKWIKDLNLRPES